MVLGLKNGKPHTAFPEKSTPVPLLSPSSASSCVGIGKNGSTSAAVVTGVIVEVVVVMIGRRTKYYKIYVSSFLSC